MKTNRILFVCLLLGLVLGLPLVLLGRPSVEMSKHLVTLDPGYFGETVPREGLAKAKGPEDPSLGRLGDAYRQVKKIRAKRDRAAGLQEAGQEPLPQFLADDPMVSKVVIAAFESLSNGQRTRLKIARGDAQGLIATVAQNFGARAGQGQAVERGGDTKVLGIIKEYLLLYYCDDTNGFVDREGTVYKAPEFKGSIDNDVITALVGIVFEGLFDALLPVPVYVKGDGETKYQTKNHKEPSAHRLKYAGEETIVAEGQNGIDEYEHKAIRFLSSLAADQSKLISGAAYRMFGNLEIGFIVGGDFAVGDNETLAQVLDTTFAVSSRRLVEAAAYKGFKGPTDRAVRAPDTPAARLIADLKRLKQG
jgi:hypothetical protein